MHRRTIGRAAAAALAGLLAATSVAMADTIPADGDAVTSGNQSLVDLGAAAPGAIVQWPVTFRLTCAGLSHAEPGTTIELALESGTVPLDGAAGATTTTIGPVPADWPPPGEGCPSPAPTLAATNPSIVSLTMPTTPGNDYEFTVAWSRSGSSGLTGSSIISFTVDVVANTPPTLTLPAAISAEATSAAGAAVTFSATAEDAEDATPPTPSCLPASGSTFPLGTTTVGCTVTDGGELSASGSFSVTVADTTAPALTLPATLSVITTDLAGATVDWPAPTAIDLVDPDPTVVCTPASGSLFALGSTTVTCTATDDAGNSSAGSFAVEVTWVDPTVWSAAWGEPVGNSGETVVANPGRTLPVKVEIFADGIEQTQGAAGLAVSGCGGRPAADLAMSFDGGRWVALLDTARLGAPGCYEVTATLDGHAAGSFRIELRSVTPTRARR